LGDINCNYNKSAPDTVKSSIFEQLQKENQAATGLTTYAYDLHRTPV